jgi:hypothetical protein
MVYVAFALASVLGCSKSAGPPGEPGPDVISRLKWPGTPIESRIPGKSGKLAMHTATCTVTGPRGLVLYSVVINWLDKGMDPKEWVDDVKKAHEKDAITCEEIEFGPKKYPGVDYTTETTTQTRKVFGRTLDVLVRSTWYSVSVTSSNAELLNHADVKRFFESFVLDE